MAGLFLVSRRPAAADEGWVIESFGASYSVEADGSVQVIEDLLVNFTGVQRHGIVRSIPVVFQYDAHHDREYQVGVTSVTNGESKLPYTLKKANGRVEIDVGDANKLVTGEQRYVLSYTLKGALNAFPDYDELLWNVLGPDTPVPIQRTTVVVSAPSITRVDCKMGPVGSGEVCASGVSPSRADFESGRTLDPGDEFTIAVQLQKGTVNVPPPILVARKSLADRVRDFLGIGPITIAAAIALGLLTFAAIARLWWLQGRDRWFGDVQYLTGAMAETERPLMARETIVVEYAPPEVGTAKRMLRPAEVGLLMDERADTLDVSATIVDLAVRGYLKILEPEKHDYRLQKLKEPDDGLLDYETKLLTSLFDPSQVSDDDAEAAAPDQQVGGPVVKMKDLKDHFYDDLAEVKKRLYRLAVKDDKMFPSDPNTVRMWYAGGAALVIGLGAAVVAGLGALGAGIVGVPVVLGGLGLLAINGAMPRRTAAGRELYRRALGFREFMVTAETERARFEEEANIFEKYLPYAIVFRCTEKWAKAFEGLAHEPSASGWYVSPTPFAPALFVHDIGSFSSSVSSVMAATPSSSGSSGFSGGGFSSGGGGGGGGVGSW